MATRTRTRTRSYARGDDDNDKRKADTKTETRTDSKKRDYQTSARSSSSYPTETHEPSSKRRKYDDEDDNKYNKRSETKRDSPERPASSDKKTPTSEEKKTPRGLAPRASRVVEKVIEKLPPVEEGGEEEGEDEREGEEAEVDVGDASDNVPFKETSRSKEIKEILNGISDEDAAGIKKFMTANAEGVFNGDHVRVTGPPAGHKSNGILFNFSFTRGKACNFISYSLHCPPISKTFRSTQEGFYTEPFLQVKKSCGEFFPRLDHYLACAINALNDSLLDEDNVLRSRAKRFELEDDEVRDNETVENKSGLDLDDVESAVINFNPVTLNYDLDLSFYDRAENRVRSATLVMMRLDMVSFISKNRQKHVRL